MSFFFISTSNSLFLLLLYFGVNVLNFSITNWGCSSNALFKNSFAFNISSGCSFNFIKCCFFPLYCAVSKWVIVYSLLGSNMSSIFLALDGLKFVSFCNTILFNSVVVCFICSVNSSLMSLMSLMSILLSNAFNVLNLGALLLFLLFSYFIISTVKIGLKLIKPYILSLCCVHMWAYFFYK